MSEKADLPDLLYSDTEQALADSISSLLADRGSVDKVLARTESIETYDEALWQAVAGDLGCAGLLIPERAGGAGASYREACSAAEALGAAVAPVPFLGSSVVATAALLSAASDWPDGTADGLLRRMADGGVTAALAVPFATAPGAAFPLPVRVTAPRPGDERTGVARLRGMVSGAADALPASVLLVPADGVPHGLYLVDMSAQGVAKAPVVSLDMTRQLCDLSFDDVPGTLIASGPAATRAYQAALTAGAGVLASELTGLAQRCLDMTVAYVKERRQFGRPVGSFQGAQAPAGRRVGHGQPGSRRVPVRRGLPGLRCARHSRRGGPGQGVLLGRRGAGRAGVRPVARWHRLYLGTPRAPVPETREGRFDRVRHRGRAPGRAGRPGRAAGLLTDDRRRPPLPSRTRPSCGAGPGACRWSRRSGCSPGRTSGPCTPSPRWGCAGW